MAVASVLFLRQMSHLISNEHYQGIEVFETVKIDCKSLSHYQIYLLESAKTFKAFYQFIFATLEKLSMECNFNHLRCAIIDTTNGIRLRFSYLRSMNI